MSPGLSCPRCGRHNSSRARFCANCGLSFLSAGLISEPTQPERSGGSGLLGVIVGFLLIFFVVAVVSFIRLAIPSYAHFGPRYSPAIQYDQVRTAPYEPDRLIRRDVQWRFDFPRQSPARLNHGCRD